MHDDIDAAMLLEEALSDGLGRRLVGDIDKEERAADVPRDDARRAIIGRTIEDDDMRTFRREELSRRLADAARGAGDERDLALKRTGHGIFIALGLLRDAERLPRHKGRMLREEEAKGRADACLGALLDKEHIGGVAGAARLFAEASDEAVEPRARGGLNRRVGILGRTPDHDEAAMLCE